MSAGTPQNVDIEALIAERDDYRSRFHAASEAAADLLLPRPDQRGDEAMKAFVAGWFARARNPKDAPLLVEEAWHAYRADTRSTPALAPLIQQAKAEALREAADAVENECSGSRSACYCTSATWLRERADTLVTPAPTGPEECYCPDPLREVSAFCPLHGHSPERRISPERSL